MMREMDFVDEYYADRDLSLLKKLTLVIPTYNRNYYLSRCLWYHAHFPYGEIIVADSSPEEKKVVNRETVQKIREMFGAKIQYLEYEPETEKHGGDIYRKWRDAVQHVETEYSQIVT
ncbi:MAG TPA: TIGR00180 family glycosyltransferase, partial [Methanocorpusculum sp.]|nr:TIGR00180 family glycosyltransferase [Methanocorpusculum sp.]